MKPLNRLSNWACSPPYEGIIWLAWLYVVFACLVQGEGPFAGNLAWFDDHVRMVQVLDWINGQSWYDHTIHRVNAPEGFHTIWSRLVDLPIAAIILPLQNWIGQHQAAMTASIILPLIQTLMLFFATTYLAAPLVGKQNARLVVLFVLFSSCINAEYFTLAGFQLGAVGHHAWYVILTILMCGATARLVTNDGRKELCIAGFSIAALLAIGIEAIPLIGGLCATLAIISWHFNRADIAKRAAAFTALGALGGFILLPAYQPPDQLLSISFAEPSALGPLLVTCAAVFFAFQFVILQKYGKQKAICAVCFLVLAAALVTALLYIFPQILNGPAAALTPEERQIAAFSHTEAMPLFKVAQSKIDLLRLMMPLVIALGYAGYRLRTANRKDATLYALYLGSALVPFGMILFFSRYYHHAMMMACPWLTLALIQVWRRMPTTKAYYLNGLLAFIALGPLWTFLIPAALANAPFTSSFLLFPAKRQEKNELCDAKTISGFLNSYFNNDKVIMVPMYRSAEFLFNAQMHIFFLANFPSQNKFIPVQKFYQTRSPNEARQIIFDHNIDLIAVCKLGGVHNAAMFNPALTAQASSFNQQLLDGVIPDWLTAVPVNIPTPYLLFEVRR